MKEVSYIKTSGSGTTVYFPAEEKTLNCYFSNGNYSNSTKTPLKTLKVYLKDLGYEKLNLYTSEKAFKNNKVFKEIIL